IKVGEFQHGVITKLHPAYNYGAAVFNNEGYKEYLPDYLLTYGDFWNEQVTTPSKKVTIGNPHFWFNYDRFKATPGIETKVEKSKKILIVSQGTVTNINVELAKKLSNMVESDYKIVFRLHPGEVAFKERYQELFNYNNIEVNDSGDIYQLILSSDYVVSVYSTTIFEAASFGKPVYIYRHPLSELYIPENLGLWFSTAKELLKLIINDRKASNDFDLNYFWNEKWKENYLSFLEQELGI
ncbi:CDP-glycerol glycerophosphotransferase family protein, partial [Fervidobacterium sp.]